MGKNGGMKLLLDENISRRIMPLLQKAYPESTQVVLAGPERMNDRAVWDFAREGNYVIVTKDDDFLDLLSILDYPPKVILLKMGNCSNQLIVEALVRSKDDIASALASPDAGLVEIY
jgi:Uncharacterized protein conserved in bacteria